jgi:membrane protein
MRLPALLNSLIKRTPALDGPLQLLYGTVQLYGKNGLANHAAATAFYFLLSATPAVLLMSYALQLLAHWAENSVAATLLMAALYNQLQLDSLTSLGIVPRQAQLTAGGVGLLTLLLSSRGLINAVQGAFRIIFPEEAKRRLVLSWTLPFLLLPLLMLLAGLAAVVQTALAFFAEYALIGALSASLLKALNALLSVGLLWLVIFAAFWRLPLRCPPVRHAALTALGATISIVLLLSVFGAFFQLDNYRALYGALGSVVFVLIGAFMVCLVFYFWAQALYALGKLDVAALERLFLSAQDTAAAGTGVDSFVFGNARRLLNRYGRQCAAGETLVQEGEASRDAYLLYAGRAAVYKATPQGPKKLGELGEGQLFGEMAYLLRENRTASVLAETELTVLVLSPEMLEELMRYSAPLSRRIIDTLCKRLEHMNRVSQQGT